VVHELSFDLVDDVILALAAKTVTETELPAISVRDLGPMMELRHSGLKFSRCKWLDLGRHADLVRAIGSGTKWFSNSGMQGCVRIAQHLTNDSGWTEFAMRGKKAATLAGFAGDEAGQLFGAINELRNNVAEHSENPTSGYLAYDAIQDQFEFVVADAGVGVLKSLRTHPHYSHVTDSGTALNLALSEGVSRHYSDKDRGLGFRPIFVGLANASEHLRFCSGDHTKELTRGVDRRVISSTRQKAPLSGFFCSVRCAPHNK
jgi:anti-sigma regulatory factor (Ser/Thr protein kinase)